MSVVGPGRCCGRGLTVRRLGSVEDDKAWFHSVLIAGGSRGETDWPNRWGLWTAEASRRSYCWGAASWRGR